MIFDESSGMKITGKRNVMMDRVWVLNDEQAGHQLNIQNEKFDCQFMVPEINPNSTKLG